MRAKDENKVKAIKEAVITLCQADGFTNLTTAKVAKMAGVSPATIYLNYKDKTDMLSRLYKEVKNDLHKDLTNVIAAAGNAVEDQLRAMLRYSIDQAQRYPKESHFISALWTNQELLDTTARTYGTTEAEPLTKLYLRINASPDFINAPAVILATVATLPTMVLQTSATTVDDAMIDQAIDLTVKTLKR